MPTQTQSGKAFEYALLKALYDRVSPHQNVDLVENSAYSTAFRAFTIFPPEDQQHYYKASEAAVKHLLKLEPRLNHALNNKDKLQLKIVPDAQGIAGDVRDIIAVRSEDDWEIGISAKNHHRAVKHSRLSAHIDFGEKWLGLPCSQEYFNKVAPLFYELENMRAANKKWRQVSDKHHRYYMPILSAFQEELLRLDDEFPGTVPQQLVHYLIGDNDFYKVIKDRSSITIQGFNFNGTFNKKAGSYFANFKVPRLNLPARIIDLDFKPNSTTTVILVCDQGWQISFRIHSASTRVENSLKFDITLEGQPGNLYTHTVAWD